jgi:phosphomannomutase
MVTGSHIPADRNGLKFYIPSGEISKADEALILEKLDQPHAPAGGGTIEHHDARSAYMDRYKNSFDGSLSGLRVGVYQHSSVARDMLVEICTELGAEVSPIARSDTFIPVDTEAVDPGVKAQIEGWFDEHKLDVLISTDGDADRPMVVDHSRRVVPGDVLGVLTAQCLNANVIATPINSNSMVRDVFPDVHLTQIGSPFVIDEMEAQIRADASARVVGYEANGGFLLGFEHGSGKAALQPLMTRDSILPILAPLHLAKERGTTLAGLIADLPSRFTAANRITNTPTERAHQFLAELGTSTDSRMAFFSEFGKEASIDQTDGLRVTFESGDILHLRPSGNAPEFRCYAEASDRRRAEALVASCLELVSNRLK